MSDGSFITGIAHYGLRVRSLERAREFYERLGFRFLIGPVGPEPVAILKHPSGIELNLILNAPEGSAPNILMDVPEKHPGYTHVALAVDDIDAALQALKDMKIEISEGPVVFDNGPTAIFVRDPDRNVIEFHYNPDWFKKG